MAHLGQLLFVQTIRKEFPQFFTNNKVLEVGSLNINGSIRDFFKNCDYTGVDLGEGPGVDVICKGEDLDYPNGTYDVVASCECFEHNENWKETFVNMHRMTRPGGLIFFTCATTGREEHGTTRTTPFASPFTLDYYRNLTEEDFADLPLATMFSQFKFTVDKKICDLSFVGIKHN